MWCLTLSTLRFLSLERSLTIISSPISLIIFEARFSEWMLEESHTPKDLLLARLNHILDRINPVIRDRVIGEIHVSDLAVSGKGVHGAWFRWSAPAT